MFSNVKEYSDMPQILLDEIERVRREGIDREVFTLCKNEKYGQLIENLENVEDSPVSPASGGSCGRATSGP